MSKQPPITSPLDAAYALKSRFKNGKESSDDKTLVMAYCRPGETDWKPALERYIKSVREQVNSQVAMFVSNDQMFGLYDGNSVAPNQILRGRLFSPVARGRRKVLNRLPVVKFNGGELLYSGTQLDQSDFDVLLLLISLLSESTPSGNVEKLMAPNDRVEYLRIKFTRYSFLKKLKRSTNSTAYEWLDSSLIRLKGVLQASADSKSSINGPIIGKHFVDADSGMVVVDINADYIKLFGGLDFTFIKIDDRLKLGNGFIKWLHGFILTNSKNQKTFYSAEKLMSMSGSSTTRVRQWMSRQATPAFKKLEERGLIKSFRVDGHIYTWYR